MKSEKDMILEDEPPRLQSQKATAEEWRTITNSSRNNEETEQKKKYHPVVDVTVDGNKV